MWFDSLGGGLKAADGGNLSGFVIAGPDREFHQAGAHIDGDTVVVWSPKVKTPVAVRYGWRADPPSDALQPQWPARVAVPNRRLAGRRDAGVMSGPAFRFERPAGAVYTLSADPYNGRSGLGRHPSTRVQREFSGTERWPSG